MIPTNTARRMRNRKQYEKKAKPFLKDRQQQKIEELEARVDELEQN